MAWAQAAAPASHTPPYRISILEIYSECADRAGPLDCDAGMDCGGFARPRRACAACLPMRWNSWPPSLADAMTAPCVVIQPSVGSSRHEMEPHSHRAGGAGRFGGVGSRRDLFAAPES